MRNAHAHSKQNDKAASVSKYNKTQMEIKRKLYTRGSSHETTIPKPLLFSSDLTKKHNVIFQFDNETKRWYIEFEEQ